MHTVGKVKNKRQRWYTRLIPAWLARKENKGQALTEFALAVPIFLLLTFGVVEFGRVLFVYSQVYTASREASRYGAAVKNIGDCSGIIAAAVRVGHFGGVSDASNVEVFYDDSSANPSLLTTWHQDKDPITGSDFRSCADVAADPTLVHLGDRLIVRVNVQFTTLFGIFPTSDVVSTSARTVIKGVDVYESAP